MLFETRKNRINGKRIFKFEGIINRNQTFGNDFGFAGKSAKMMASIGVVRFDDMRV